MSKNQEQLESFTEYCQSHREERFWQALRNWNQEVNKDEGFIMVGNPATGMEDTFYRE